MTVCSNWTQASVSQDLGAEQSWVVWCEVEQKLPGKVETCSPTSRYQPSTVSLKSESTYITYYQKSCFQTLNVRHLKLPFMACPLEQQLLVCLLSLGGLQKENGLEQVLMANLELRADFLFWRVLGETEYRGWKHCQWADLQKGRKESRVINDLVASGEQSRGFTSWSIVTKSLPSVLWESGSERVIQRSPLQLEPLILQEGLSHSFGAQTPCPAGQGDTRRVLGPGNEECVPLAGRVQKCLSKPNQSFLGRQMSPLPHLILIMHKGFLVKPTYNASSHATETWSSLQSCKPTWSGNQISNGTRKIFFTPAFSIGNHAYLTC